MANNRPAPDHALSSKNICPMDVMGVMIISVIDTAVVVVVIGRVSTAAAAAAADDDNNGWKGQRDAKATTLNA
jgi:hypothetical protein